MYLYKNGLLPDSFNHTFLLTITVTHIHVILEVRIPTSGPRTQRITGAYVLLRILKVSESLPLQ